MTQKPTEDRPVVCSECFFSSQNYPGSPKYVDPQCYAGEYKKGLASLSKCSFKNFDGTCSEFQQKLKTYWIPDWLAFWRNK